MRTPNEDEGFHNNPNLKRAGVKYEFTQDQVLEFTRCATDIMYFIENYVKVVHPDPSKGLIPFKPWPFQRKFIQHIADDRFVIAKFSRQSGKSTSTVATILWHIIFNPNYSVGVLANKAAQANELLKRIKTAYENLPKWLQHGIVKWGEKTILLENGSSVIAAATSSSSIRGQSLSCVDGSSVITIRDSKTNEIKDITIYQLEELLINESKSFSRQQIYKNILSNYLQKLHKLPECLLGETSYNTPSAWWNRRSTESSLFTCQSSFARTQIIDKNGTRELQEKNGICLYENADGPPGITVKEVSTSTRRIYKRVLDSYEQTLEALLGITGYTRENFSTKIRSAENSRAPRKYIESSYRPEENQRAFRQNKQKSRQNSEDSSQTSRNETITRSSRENELSCTWQNTMEQRYEILTPEGFKSFKGVYRKFHQQRYKLVFDNNQHLICTADHKIYTPDGKVQAGDLKPGSTVITVSGTAKVISFDLYNYGDVFDIIDVQDTHNFICNQVVISNCLYLDEFAHINMRVQNEFYQSTYPTISAGEETKIIITSTPYGMNLFYKIWVDAKDGKNNFIPIESHWSDVPGRDEKWKEETIKNIGGEQKFREEFDTEFVGSLSTLISPAKLLQLKPETPLRMSEELAIYQDPQEGHVYTAIVDTSKGVERDASTIVIVDITKLPYVVVARYKSNKVTPMLFPSHIEDLCRKYNECFVLIETNKIDSIVYLLQQEIGYENIFYTTYNTQKKAKRLSFASGAPGVETDKKIKRIGCLTLRDIVESDKIILNDEDLIDELCQFVQVKDSFEADPDSDATDNLVMPLVLFGWMLNETLFKDFLDHDLREKLLEKKQVKFDDKILPLPIHLVAVESNNVPVLSSSMFDKWVRDEYQTDNDNTDDFQHFFPI